MDISRIFRKVQHLSADEVRSFLKEREQGEINLVDVRQPGEYGEEHIPGALLIPLPELEKRLAELDPKKPTITY